MPIPIKICDNTSTIKIKAKSTDDEIKIQSNCKIDKKVIEALIELEKQERIDADENLQFQIWNKEDKIKYIELLVPQGKLDKETLSLLVSNRLNRIIYKNNYYMLGTKYDNYWTYIGSTQDPNKIYTIVVDSQTGDFIYSLIENVVLQNHIDNENIHVQSGEREFWNNKLNFQRNGELLEFNRN